MFYSLEVSTHTCKHVYSPSAINRLLSAGFVAPAVRVITSRSTTLLITCYLLSRFINTVVALMGPPLRCCSALQARMSSVSRGWSQTWISLRKWFKQKKNKQEDDSSSDHQNTHTLLNSGTHSWWAGGADLSILLEQSLVFWPRLAAILGLHQQQCDAKPQLFFL